jgi:hypothetical protein
MTPRIAPSMRLKGLNTSPGSKQGFHMVIRQQVSPEGEEGTEGCMEMFAE